MNATTAGTETNWNTAELLNVSWHKLTTIANNYLNATEKGEENSFAILPLICGVSMTGVTLVVFIVTWSDRRLKRPHNIISFLWQ